MLKKKKKAKMTHSAPAEAASAAFATVSQKVPDATSSLESSAGETVAATAAVGA